MLLLLLNLTFNTGGLSKSSEYRSYTPGIKLIKTKKKKNKIIKNGAHKTLLILQAIKETMTFTLRLRVHLVLDLSVVTLQFHSLEELAQIRRVDRIS